MKVVMLFAAFPADNSVRVTRDSSCHWRRSRWTRGWHWAHQRWRWNWWSLWNEVNGACGVRGDRVSGGGSLSDGGGDGDLGWVAEGLGGDDTASLSVSHSTSKHRFLVRLVKEDLGQGKVILWQSFWHDGPGPISEVPSTTPPQKKKIKNLQISVATECKLYSFCFSDMALIFCLWELVWMVKKLSISSERSQLCGKFAKTSAEKCAKHLWMKRAKQRWGLGHSLPRSRPSTHPLPPFKNMNTFKSTV